MNPLLHHYIPSPVTGRSGVVSVKNLGVSTVSSTTLFRMAKDISPFQGSIVIKTLKFE
jgi:hypothetical protein